VSKRNDTLHRIATGVPGLDEVLGGGLLERSFNLIAGEPGTGKTTLAQQLVFANATPERKAVYFTVLGEPALKMLQYLRQMSFYDATKIGDSIHFVDLSEEVLKDGLGKVLQIMVAKVRELEPAYVIVDSFRTMASSRHTSPTGELEFQAFLQRLALYLTSWEATTFLIGEYNETELSDNPLFTIADSVCWLTQCSDRNSVVRKCQIRKLRGQAPMPGLHTFRIDQSGIRIFPRIMKRPERKKRELRPQRLTIGIPRMDDLLGGGIPVGDTVLFAGPSGTGKTCFAVHFAAGNPDEEPAVVVVFEEHPDDYVSRADAMGFDFSGLIRRDKLRVFSLRPLDLSVDETLLELEDIVSSIGACRLVIDSLTGFELALAPSFRTDFKESLYRMVGALTGAGVTILMTIEVLESWNELKFSPHEVSFLTENIVILRYVEIAGQLRKVLSIVKMRRSAHATGLYEFTISGNGIHIREQLGMYRGLLTGEPKREVPMQPVYPGLSTEETSVFEALMRTGEATEDDLVVATGLHRDLLSRDLDRLVALNYVVEANAPNGTLYRPLARTLGA
jgi:circadian clock protein KaiC